MEMTFTARLQPSRPRLSNRYTTSNSRHDLVERQPAPRAPVLQAIEELARTRKQALNLQDEIEGFKLNLNQQWGSEDKETGG